MEPANKMRSDQPTMDGVDVLERSPSHPPANAQKALDGMAQHPVQALEPDAPVKRGRGRPRKIKPPKFDWVAWTTSED